MRSMRVAPTLAGPFTTPGQPMTPPEPAALALPRIVVLVSGDDTQLRALIDAGAALGGRIVAVFGDRRAAEGLDRAHEAGIPTRTLSPRAFAVPADFDATLGAQVSAFAPDLVVIADERAPGPAFLRRFGERVLTLRPTPIEQAWNEARAGRRSRVDVTVQRAIEPAGAGAVLATAEVPIDPTAPLDALADAMRAAGSRLLVEAIATECRRLAHERRHDPSVVWPIVRPAENKADFRIFTVEQHGATHPTHGTERTFSVIRSTDWVNVIALTTDDEVVLVRQFRHGTGTVTVEIPGGMVDPGEGFVEAGARELREETGYVAERWLDIGVVEPNPAIQDNRCATVLALDARKDHDPEFDAGEFIAVQTAPLAAVRGLIARGQITHSLVVAAFFHFIEYAGGWRRPE